MSWKKIVTAKTTKFFDLFVADITKLSDHNESVIGMRNDWKRKCNNISKEERKRCLLP